MADLADVERAIQAVITQAVYPDGTASPSVAGTDVIIYRGWPIPGNLDNDLAAGKVNVSDFPLDDEQKTTRYPKEWQPLAGPVNNLTITASGGTLVVGGTPASPLNAVAFVDRWSYAYAVQPGDTLASIATGLAALINEDNSAYSSGVTITVPGAYLLGGRTGGFGTMQREIKRQKRSFLITFWCPDPDTRDAVVPPVDAALADIDYLSLPDGSAGRLVYAKSRVVDRSEREDLYRRDLVYSVEYPTTETRGVAQVVAAPLQMTDFGGIPLDSPGNLLLAEDGQAVLTESGQRITVGKQRLTAEDGTYILTEDGQRINLES